MDETQELIKAYLEARAGNWFPIAIVSGVFSIVIFLLIYIWRQIMADNENRHQEHEKKFDKSDILLEELTKNSTEQKVLLQRIESRLENQDDKIEVNKEEINRLRA